MRRSATLWLVIASIALLGLGALMLRFRPMQFTGPSDELMKQMMQQDVDRLRKKTGIEARYVGDFANGLARFVVDVGLGDLEGRSGFINEDYEVVIPPRYALAWDFNERGLALVQTSAGMGLIDRTGAEFIACTNDIRNLWMPDENGVCMAEKSDGRWGAIDMTENWVVQPTYESPSEVQRVLKGAGDHDGPESG